MIVSWPRQLGVLRSAGVVPRKQVNHCWCWGYVLSSEFVRGRRGGSVIFVVDNAQTTLFVCGLTCVSPARQIRPLISFVVNR
eukprot:scaffold4805_cov136-Cylindrotheca_fusiformis.AAC.15